MRRNFLAVLLAAIMVVQPAEVLYAGEILTDMSGESAPEMRSLSSDSPASDQSVSVDAVLDMAGDGTSEGADRPGAEIVEIEPSLQEGDNNKGTGESQGTEPGGDLILDIEEVGDATGGSAQPGGTSADAAQSGTTAGGSVQPGGTSADGSAQPGGAAGDSLQPDGTLDQIRVDEISEHSLPDDGTAEDQELPEGAVLYSSGSIQAVLADGILTLSGSGDMENYGKSYAPWYDARGEIKEIILEDGIASIGEGAFFGCIGIRGIAVPDSVRSIGAGAFADCRRLKKADLGTGVREIGDYAFQGTGITTLVVPASVSRIGERVCYNCGSFTGYQVDKANSAYCADGGVLFNKDKTVLLDYPGGLTADAYKIPDGVTAIGETAFYRNTYLRAVAIPASVTAIGDWAFHSCELLGSLKIPDSVTMVGNGILQDCRSLQSVVVGKGVTALSDLMFSGCGILSNVSLGKNVQEVGAKAFYECTTLQAVSLPGSVKKIGALAFYGCASLTSLALPSGIEEIESGAFTGCRKLSLRYPSKLALMEDGSYCDTGYVCMSGIYHYNSAREVLELVNQERAARGLSPLVMDSGLQSAAMLRAAEICIDFSHTRPTGLDCFSVSAKALGENIAAGGSTANSTVSQWMNSEGHRANILAADFTTIGVGCFEQNGRRFWVQLFGKGPASVKERSSDCAVTVKIFINTERYTLSLGKKKNKIAVGQAIRLQPRIMNPGLGNVWAEPDVNSFRWTSSDPSAASVDGQGMVTGTGRGKTVVTCVSADGKNLTASAKIVVRKSAGAE